MVTVRFDAKKLSYKKLLAEAKEHGCASKVWTTNSSQVSAARSVVGDKAVPLGSTRIRAASESDQVYYLRHSPLRFLPLTPLQARRVNGAMYHRQDLKTWLSPRQVELLATVTAKLTKNPKALDGLERPDDLAQLDEYETKLRARLAR